MNMIPNEIYIVIDPIWERTSKKINEKMGYEENNKFNMATRRSKQQNGEEVTTVRGGS